MQRSKRRLLLMLVAFVVVGSCTFVGLKDLVLYNASRDEVPFPLPVDATNINFYRPGAFGPNVYLEFNTSEDSFLEWVQQFSRVRPAENEGPIHIYRYHAYGPGADPSPEVTFEDGRLFEWIQGDRGERIAYDADAGRAYYQENSR